MSSINTQSIKTPCNLSDAVTDKPTVGTRASRLRVREKMLALLRMQPRNTQRVPVRGVEEMEPRLVLSVEPVVVGAVYVEEDLGSDLHGDTFYLSFQGGAPGTQLNRVMIDGDQDSPGFSVGDVFFDINSNDDEPGNGRFGADISFPFRIVNATGIDDVRATVVDGSTRLELEFEGFDAGDVLEFQIDVDEVEDFNPNETDTQTINDGFDPITSGVEFQGSLFVSEFSAPHFESTNLETNFLNRYDPVLEGKGLDLPADDENGQRDRTAGAAAEATQVPIPASLSGHVYHDRNLNGQRDEGEEGIEGVRLTAIPVDTIVSQATQTVVTDAEGNYHFDGLMPGEYRVVEEQPEGFLDGLDRAGFVDGIVSGEAINPGDVIQSIQLSGGSRGTDYDFGEIKSVSIGGSVHLATPDGDCFSEDVYHEPVVGARVVLLDASGIMVQETTTGDDGSYMFDDLVPGTYSVREYTPSSLLEGGAQVGNVDGEDRGVVLDPNQVDLITLLSGEELVDLEFCDVEPVTIQGRVQLATPDGDCFGDDADHEPVVGARVQLIDENGLVVDETVTDSDGRYRFDQLDPGTYSVREFTPAGLFDGGAQAGHVAGQSRGIVAGPGEVTRILLGPGEALEDLDFCELEPVTIRGRVELATVDGDCFGDDELHQGVSDATVQLRDETGQVVAQTTTDENGYYEFTGLEPGTYSLFEVTPVGLIDAGAKAGLIDGDAALGASVIDANTIGDITLNSGQVATEFDFCEFAPSSLAGFVYHDRDDNGARDTGEQGIAEVTVQLLDESGAVAAETMTDANGAYEFQQLVAGNYTLVELHPQAWFDGLDSPGVIDGVATGTAINPGDRIENIRLGWGQSGAEFNFGELLGVSIFGDVHLSTMDGDCFSTDVEHPPLADVVVQLLDGNGVVVDQTLTDENGQYRFVGLTPGEYGVRELTPAHLIDGGANSPNYGRVLDSNNVVEIYLGSGETATEVSFCEHVPSILSGYVYHDANNDGHRDDLEDGVEAVTIRLLDESGVEVTRTTTDAFGYYQFEVAAGNYTLVESQPVGWLDGLDAAGTINGVSVGRANNPGDSIEEVRVMWGQQGDEYNFGELQPASIEGFVHVDLDADCVLDPNEVTLAGVRIELLNSSGEVIASQRTDSEGRFEFNSLLPDRYTLREIQPVGYFNGLQRAGTGGGDTAVDNVISEIEVESGDTLVDYGFCEEPPSEISGFVFQDGPSIQLGFGEELPDDLSTIRDGQLTDDDTMLTGVVLELRDGIYGTPILGGGNRVLPGAYGEGPITTTTDANGYYHFPGLKKGNYAIYEIHPEGFIDGIDTPGTQPARAFNPTPPGVPPTPQGDLIVNPNFDAIVQIALPPNTSSELNNFSEVQANRLPNIPIDPPEPRPPIELADITWAMPDPFERIVTPLDYQPRAYGHVRPVSGTTWHLSVIDGGQPRGNGLSTLPDGPYWSNDEGSAYKSVWDDPTAVRMDWVILDSNGNPISGIAFGLRRGLPVAGDFNGDGKSEIGVFVEGEWFIDINGNGEWDEDDLWAKLGYRDDQPVVGDWDGDGKDDIGTFGRAWAGDPRAIRREPGLPDLDNSPSGAQKNQPPAASKTAQGRRQLRYRKDGETRSDAIDHVFHYGAAGDRAVAGDWNGDGIGNIGIFNAGIWHLDMNGDGEFTDADKEFKFGEQGDIPIVGDFDGDGVDEVGIMTGGRLVLDMNGNFRVDEQDRYISLPIEHTNAQHVLPVVGDWDGDGRDEVAVTGRGATLRFAEVDSRDM